MSNTENTITETTDENPIYQVTSKSGERSETDRMDEIKKYRETVRNNIEYDIVRKRYTDSDRQCYDEIYELICDVVSKKGGTIRIG